MIRISVGFLAAFIFCTITGCESRSDRIQTAEVIPRRVVKLVGCWHAAVDYEWGPMLMELTFSEDGVVEVKATPVNAIPGNQVIVEKGRYTTSRELLRWEGIDKKGTRRSYRFESGDLMLKVDDEPEIRFVRQHAKAANHP